MYLQELPTTGEIIFSDFLLASSSNLVSELSRATELRTRIRALLKANRRDDATHSTRDWLQIVKATEEYLPHLFAIHNCLQTDDIILKYDAEFSWRSCFSASLIGPPPRIAIRGIHYELVSTLLLSGTSLSNLATSIIAALGPSYERDRLLSSADRKAKDDKLKMAADMLCRAAGIFDYIASSLIPAWENAAGYIDPRPPETTAELASALSKLALADAQTLAIRKLLSPSVALAEDTITPGPPLPKSHPSPSLLAKLHLETCALYESAEQLARLSGSKRPGGGGEGGGAGSSAASSIPLGSSASGRVGGSGGTRAIEPVARLVGVGQDEITAVRRGEYVRPVPGTSGPPAAGAYAYEESDGSSSHGPPGGGVANQADGKNKPSRILHFASRLGGGGGGGGAGGGGTHDRFSRPGSSDKASPTAFGASSSYSHPGVTSTLLNYLSTNALFVRAQAYRWLGVDSGEQRSAYGEAIAYLALAREELEDGDAVSSSATKENGNNGSGSGGPKKISKFGRKLVELSTSAAGISPKRKKELKAELRAKAELELRDVAHWTRAYTKINDSITFYPIPPPTEMLSRIPVGRAALALKPYTPPAPAFGPGSDGEVASERMRRLGFGYSEEDLDGAVDGLGEGVGGGGATGASPSADVGSTGIVPPEGSLLGTERNKAPEKPQYAGAGAYY
ncbi:hypothetical protein V8E36_002268 [Tilletia maclaganii]